eukprot:Em0004g731a
MTRGYVEISVTRCLILGAAGVGKTHLKHLLLKKDPPGLQVSTGLADNPIRSISFSWASVDGPEDDDWFVVEDDKTLLSIIVKTIQHRGVSIASSLADVVETFPKMVVNLPVDGSDVDSNPVPSDVVATNCISQRSITNTVEDELIHQIHCSFDRRCASCGEQMFRAKCMQIIDSGGQLQYHDILPLFIRNTTVAIFVLNISEELSQCPVIKCCGDDGKPFDKSYQSHLSHKQILQHCLRTVCSADTSPEIITVGTHRDVADQCSESIEEKNRQLKELFDAGSFSVLCKGEEVIFLVNTKAPQEEDRYVAKILRQRIIAKSPKSIKMPIAWFGLEVALQRSSHNGILSLVECQSYAKRLHIEHDSFSAALHYLVYHNIFLYYPDILPQTVFSDPQVILNKCTELVQFHHKLRNNSDETVAVRKDVIKFRDHGILSLDILKSFTKHYEENLFTPQDFLKLLLKVQAIATFGHEIVTLVDKFSYIEVLIDECSSEACREVIRLVRQGIENAYSLLNYTSMQFEEALMCPGTSCASEPAHLALVVKRSGIYKWKCTVEGDQRGDLTEKQLMWLCPSALDGVPSLPDLMNKVAAVIPDKYEAIGLQLGLTQSQLHAIRPCSQKLEDYNKTYSEIFDVWRRNGSLPYTWKTVINVLKSASVGEVKLSKDLENWICSS